MNIVMATEAISVGKEMFYLTSAVGIILIVMVFCILALVFFSVLIRWLRSSMNKDEHYNLFEMGALRKVAEKAGIDMTYEKKLMDIQNGKTFRRRLEEKVIEDIFGKEEKKKKETKKE